MFDPVLSTGAQEELPSPGPPGPASDASKARLIRRRRLRACDGCRQRKIRCDNGPGSCRNCRIYGVDCVITRAEDGTDIKRGSCRSDCNRHGAKADCHCQNPGSPPKTGNVPVSSRPSPANSQTNRQITVGLERDSSNNNSSNSSVNNNPNNETQTTNGESPSASSRPHDVLEGVVVIETSRVPQKSKFAGMSSVHVLAKSAEELFKSEDRTGQVDVMAFFCPLMALSEEVATPPLMLRPLVEREKARKIFRYSALHRAGIGRGYNLAFVRGPLSGWELERREQDVLSVPRHCDRRLVAGRACDPKRALYDGVELAYLAIGSAVRMAQSIGLHRRLAAHKRPQELVFVQKDIGLRSRVWWTCYWLDKKLSFEGGRPSCISDPDCDADLPTSDEVLSSSSLSRQSRQPAHPNVFSDLINLCKVLSLISSNLYSRDVAECSEEELLARISQAERQLRGWAETLPDGLRPGRAESLLAAFESQPASPQFGSRVLHCMYHNALLTIHRASLLSCANMSSEGAQKMAAAARPDARIVASANACLSAAAGLARSVDEFVCTPRCCAMVRLSRCVPLMHMDAQTTEGFNALFGRLRAAMEASRQKGLGVGSGSGSSIGQAPAAAAFSANGHVQHHPPPDDDSPSSLAIQDWRAGDETPNQQHGPGDVGEEGLGGLLDYQLQDYMGDDFGLLNVDLWPAAGEDLGTMNGR
uniref:Zn(2)-C6 fungal-type domain-containing protein n=1 Tax=Pyricularia oryzae (strain P131) TaxID=1143193 RepID=L7JBG1_PYRO1